MELPCWIMTLRMKSPTANMWKQKDNFWVPDDHGAPICLALNHLPPGSFYVKKEKKKVYLVVVAVQLLCHV